MSILEHIQFSVNFIVGFATFVGMILLGIGLLKWRDQRIRTDYLVYRKNLNKKEKANARFIWLGLFFLIGAIQISRGYPVIAVFKSLAIIFTAMGLTWLVLYLFQRRKCTDSNDQ